MSNRLPDREWLEGSKLGPPNSDATDESAANTMVMVDRQEFAELRRQLSEMTAERDGMVDLYTTVCLEQLEMQGRVLVAEQVREEVLAENERLRKQLAETEALRKQAVEVAVQRGVEIVSLQAQAAAMKRALEYGIKELSAYFESCGRPGRTPKLHRILERQRKAVDAIDAGKALKATKKGGEG